MTPSTQAQIKQHNIWRDRSRQPHCNICGQFASWDDMQQKWQLVCVVMSDEGVSEHD